MQPAPSQADLARAHAAYGAGDLDMALRLALAILIRHPGSAPAHQLAAIVERRQGRPEAARTHFIAALQAAPRDPHILNSYANLLGDLGDLDAACDHYRRALTVAPGHVEAWVNLAQTERQRGRPDDAQAALERAVAIAPRHAPAWRALGLLLVDIKAFDAAAHALDTALEVDPADLRALRARGVVESEREGDALPFYARARALAPADDQLAVAEAVALYRAGETQRAERDLTDWLRSDPGSVAAHSALCKMRWQTGHDRPLDSFETALIARPADGDLWTAYLATLMRAGRHAEVLEKLGVAGSALGEAAIRFEAAAAAEGGDTDRADAAFARLDMENDPALRISYLRHLLRAGRPDQAARHGRSCVARADGAAAWPYLASAWRLIDDPRWGWLEGDPGFIGVFDLPIPSDDLNSLAGVLRDLHRARIAPMDQSLVGGTQTEGDLFARREPEIVALKGLIADAVSDYVAGLPPHDPDHPLLRPGRDGFRFNGAWSVRLAQSGFHVSHAHTQGWISSAFYVALPDTLGTGGDDTAGWLAFGEPPSQLGLDLPAFRTVRPAPGRLVLFPSTLWHGTRPFPAGERMTVAFDVTPSAAAAKPG